MSAQRTQSNWLPIEPLRRVILEDIAREVALYDPTDNQQNMGYGLLAERTGLPVRSLRRYVNENGHVEIDAADRYCIATGRHLSDVYPELYDDSRLFVQDCPRCGAGVSEVTGEGPRRIFLTCCTCRRRWLIDIDESYRHRPRPSLHVLTRAQIIEAHDYYQNGPHTAEEVGGKYGVAGTTLLRWWRLLELPVKRAGRIPTKELQASGHLHKRKCAWPMRQAALIARADGLTLSEIATQFDVSPQAIAYTLKAAEKEAPIDARVCITPGCQRYDRRYPIPPADILAVAPQLACCPDCGGEGEDGGLWRPLEQHNDTEAA